MKIWIIGANGMLGQELVELCKKRNLSFHASDSKEGDVTHLKELVSLAHLVKPSHVINCAAFTDVDRAELMEERAFAVNATGAGNVAEAVVSVGAKLLHISTDYVFDGNHVLPYQETDRCAPVNIYGKSKWEGENLILATFSQACILRASWFFGRKGRNFFSSLLDQMKTMEAIPVVCDQFSSPTYYGDLAETVIDMLDAEGIFHFCNDGGNSRDMIARGVLKIAQELGINGCCTKINSVVSSDFPSRAPRPHFALLDTHKISLYLGRYPRPWKEAFKEYLSHVNAS